MVESRKQSLLKLRSDIIDKCYKDKWIDVWFFPEYNGVKGYLGTQNLIFIGLNPSYNQFPDKYTEFFYKQLNSENCLPLNCFYFIMTPILVFANCSLPTANF